MKDLISNMGVSPAMIGIVSMWVLGIVTVLMRRVPKQLYSFFMARFTVTINMDAGQFNNYAASMLIESFMLWYMRTQNTTRLRRFLLEPSAQDRNSVASRGQLTGNSVFGPGYGLHFFFFEGRLGWFVRNPFKEKGQAIDARFLGTDTKIVERFIVEIQPDRKSVV